MTDRLIPALSISCGGLTVLYIALMISTIFFATWQTQAMSSITDAQSNIANLESNYYAVTNRISQINPTQMGFVEPSDVQYVAEATNGTTGLSFAGN
jgi:uncharacterized membrane protein YukC